VLSIDATDINCSNGAWIREDKNSFSIMCGQDTGDLQEVLGFSDTKALEKKLNALGMPVKRALESESLGYSPAERVAAIIFFKDSAGPLMEKAIAATDDHVATLDRFHKRNGGDYEKGRQKNGAHLKFKVRELARRSAVNCKSIVTTLTNGRALAVDELVAVLETLKIVIIALVDASTHYLAVLLHTPSGCLLTPVCRIYFKTMDNSQTVSLLATVKKKVEEVSQGAVIVAATTADGEHRSRMLQTAQSCAKEACMTVKEMVSGKVNEMVDDDEIEGDDGADGGHDAEGVEGGKNEDIGDEAEGQGNTPVIEGVGDLKEASGMEKKAMKAIMLCETIIAKTVMFPPREPNIVGAFKAVVKKSPPTSNEVVGQMGERGSDDGGAALVAGQAGERGSGNGGIARVVGRTERVFHITSSIDGVRIGPPPPPPPQPPSAAAAAAAMTQEPSGAEAPAASSAAITISHTTVSVPPTTWADGGEGVSSEPPTGFLDQDTRSYIQRFGGRTPGSNKESTLGQRLQRPPDGSCLFHSLTEQDDPAVSAECKYQVVKYVQLHFDECVVPGTDSKFSACVMIHGITAVQYFNHMMGKVQIAELKDWAGLAETVAFAKLYSKQIEFYATDDPYDRIFELQYTIGNPAHEVLRLIFSGTHFDNLLTDDDSHDVAHSPLVNLGLTGQQPAATTTREPTGAEAPVASSSVTTTTTTTTPPAAATATTPPSLTNTNDGTAPIEKLFAYAAQLKAEKGEDENGFTNETARAELALHSTPLKIWDPLDVPFLVQKPPLVGGKTTVLRELVWSLDEDWVQWTADINTAFQSPLITVSELPTAPMTGPEGEDLQPPAARDTLFLSARVRMQLSWVEKQLGDAKAYVTRCETLRQAAVDELKPLSKMLVGDLKKLLLSRKLNMTGLKEKLVQRLLDYAEQPASALDKDLHALVKLEGALKSPPWKPPIPMADLERFAANAVLGEVQSEGLKQGSTSRLPKKDEALAFTDPHHLFHNMTTLLIFGKDETRPVLNRKTLLEAAMTIGDTHLISILNQTVDKHSHIATHYLMTHKGLVKELRKLGSTGFRDAVVLETIGRARQAWEKPYLTMAWRNKALQATTLLLLRVFGRSIRDVGALRRQKLEGTCFTVNQFLDLLANTDALHQYLGRLSLSEYISFKHTTLSTRGLESSFSALTANMGSGEKMTQSEIQGVVPKLDALLILKTTANKGYTIVHSRRKRKFEVDADVDFNKPCKEKTERWDRDTKKRTGGYIGGRAPCNRDYNASAGGVGKR